jgi:hypothetical protein
VSLRLPYGEWLEMTQEVIQVALWKDGRNSNIQFLSSWKRLEKEQPDLYKLIEQKEGFTTKDHEYEYKVGMSKFGLWLSRYRMGAKDLQAVATAIPEHIKNIEPMEDSKPSEIAALTAAILELATAIKSSSGIKP